MRGATKDAKSDKATLNISTHTPHAGRDKSVLYMRPPFTISTHTPHAGRDTKWRWQSHMCLISTHTPHAGRDRQQKPYQNAVRISTPTPHAGRDDNGLGAEVPKADFYSHAPCGARPNGAWTSTTRS